MTVGFLTWRSDSVCGNTLDTDDRESGLLRRGDKRHTLPSHRPALLLNAGNPICSKQDYFYENSQIKYRWKVKGGEN